MYAYHIGLWDSLYLVVKIKVMTEAGKEIIKILKERTRFTLERNKEFWSELSYKDGQIIYVGGSTNGGYDEFRNQISEEEALDKMMHYFSMKARKFGEPEIKTDEEALVYWQNNSYIGG